MGLTFKPSKCRTLSLLGGRPSPVPFFLTNPTTGEKVQLKEEAPASSVPGGKYDLNLVARNEKAKVTRKSQRILGLKSISLFS